MKKTLLSTALVSLACVSGACLSGAAFADTFSGSVGLSLGSLDAEGDSAQTFGLNGQIRMVTEGGLSFGARYDSVTADLGGGFGDLSASVIGLTAGYRLGETLGLGVYVERGDLNADGFGDLGSLTSYGLTVGMVSGGLNLDGFYGQSTTSPDIEGLTIEDMGLFAAYQVSDALTLAGNAVQTRLSGEGGHADLTQTGLGGVLAVNAQLTAFGGVSRTAPDGIDVDATSYGFGLSYDTGAVSTVNAVVSVELARTRLSIEGESGDLDTLRLGVTFPFGAKAVKVPTDSVAGAILTPNHSAVSSFLLTAS